MPDILLCYLAGNYARICERMYFKAR